MEKKQTAVEWLFDNLNLCFDKFDNGEYSYTEFVNASKEIKKQAKEMEKEEIKDSWGNGWANGDVDINRYEDTAEQYYNETYKTE